MRRRRFGKTELLVSVFSLGTMRFDSAEDACETVCAAIAQGINHLETAPAYGSSECYIGQALSAIASTEESIRREQLVITSKLTPTLTADQVDKAIDDSLERLGTDYLDCVAIHGINTLAHLTWAQTHMLAPLAQAQAEGRVRHVGFFDAWAFRLDFESDRNGFFFSFINLHYNYFFSAECRSDRPSSPAGYGHFYHFACGQSRNALYPA